MKRIMFSVLLMTCFLMHVDAKKQIERTHDYYTEWAKRIGDSEMSHNEHLWQADFLKKPKWDYTQGLVAKSLLELYKATADERYLAYVQEYADFFINDKGEIMTYKKLDYNIDRVNGGIFLFDLNKFVPKQQYQAAMDSLRSQLETHPRVKEGAFWHKKRYPHQVWLDGLYMGSPFYARYSVEHNQPEYLKDVVRQFQVADKYTRDPKTGLNFHGWDESREQAWANKETGCSPHFWGRSIGWYLMAIVDVLDYIPQEMPERQELIDILNRVCKALMKYQDRHTQMWSQVTDRPKAEGNYLESTSTTMFCYAMAKGARMGYLPKKYLEEARQVFDGLCEHSTQLNEDGTTSITRACAVAGLGGEPYRSGSYEYYISEPVRNDDPKVVGPFILAALELAKSTPHIVVAKDGSGDYKTLQAAIDAVPHFKKTRTVIYIKPGIYREKIIIPKSKELLSIIGEDPLTTVISYDDYAGKENAWGQTLGTSGSATVYAFPDDLYMENITIANTAGVDKPMKGKGHQAVALHVSSDRAVFVNCRFLGNQDTMFNYAAGARQYFKNCYIEGTTDFIFGWATAVFDQCVIHSKRNSYITAASTLQGATHGFLFYQCKLTAAPGVTEVYLGRPWRPYAQTVFMECELGEHILPEGWHNWNKPQAEKQVLYGEYKNYGKGADTDNRVKWSQQLTEQQAEEYSIKNVLEGKDGWAPQTGIIRYVPVKK
ncbi:MAG: glycoside hydrolase family 88 protein [Paludibacteraceae bacterium]|nr:glycoside hydrolase family 88 protein [Paludibacteraceae bacterium]